jgi:DNA-directed RNA polymerase subunit RPC12/RpoP
MVILYISELSYHSIYTYMCPLYVANPKIAHTIIKEQGQKLAATYRCQSCKVIIQLVEIYSPTKRNAIHCPYCEKGILEPRNVIFC